MPEPEPLTVEEMARLTGRNPWLVRRWIREGRLPATRELDWPHAYRVRIADLGLVANRRRWRRHAIPQGVVPERLAAVAAIAGVGRE
jgi:hypothetical protein